MITSEILDSIIASIDDEEWTNKVYEVMRKKEPLIANYLYNVREKLGERAALVGMIVYKMLDSQAEAEAMNNGDFN